MPTVARLAEAAQLLPLSTAPVERAFSALPFIKSELRNRTDDDKLHQELLVYLSGPSFDEAPFDVFLERFLGQTHRLKQALTQLAKRKLKEREEEFKV
jgi:hypothetical protein